MCVRMCGLIMDGPMLIFVVSIHVCWCFCRSQVWELADYEQKYGDYRNNGLGHRFVDWGECKGVLVPGKRVWKVQRKTIMDSIVEQEVDSGEFQLGGDQLESLAADIAEAFLPDSEATGISLDTLVAPALESSIASVVSTTPVAIPPRPPSAFSMFGSRGVGAPATPATPVSPMFVRSAPATAQSAPTPPAPKSGSSGGADKPRAVGRPKTCVSERADEFVTRFEQCGPADVRFFGAEKNNQAKQTARLIDDLKAVVAKGDSDRHEEGGAA